MHPETNTKEMATCSISLLRPSSGSKFTCKQVRRCGDVVGGIEGPELVTVAQDQDRLESTSNFQTARSTARTREIRLVRQPSVRTHQSGDCRTSKCAISTTSPKQQHKRPPSQNSELSVVSSLMEHTFDVGGGSELCHQDRDHRRIPRDTTPLRQLSHVNLLSRFRIHVYSMNVMDKSKSCCSLSKRQRNKELSDSRTAAAVQSPGATKKKQNMNARFPTDLYLGTKPNNMCAKLDNASVDLRV